MDSFYLTPARFLFELATVHAPWIASLLGLGQGAEPIVLSIVVSTAVWVAMCATSWWIFRFAFHIRRIGESTLLTAAFNIRHWIGTAKTLIVCRYRQHFSGKSDADADSPGESSFGGFDIAVLQAAADCGPGATTSAPELAEKFGMLPSRFEQSLKKLHRDQMIDTTVGSTDGYDNYRITPHGAAFAMMLRNRNQNQDAQAI